MMTYYLKIGFKVGEYPESTLLPIIWVDKDKVYNYYLCKGSDNNLIRIYFNDKHKVVINE